MMIQDVKHGPNCHERIDERQRDPDDEREILLSERLTALLPVQSATEQRANAKVGDANSERNQGNRNQGGP